MAQPAENNNDPFTDPAPVSTDSNEELHKTVTLKIVQDGDVVVAIDHPAALIEFVVHAKVLSEASPVFKQLLASDPEAQLARSAAHPQRLVIEDQKLLIGIKQLFFALHYPSNDVLGDLEKKDERGRDVKVVEERNGDERRVPMLDRVER